ncbi:chitin deacetylase [Cladochytrium tenue]|nr:chitin deacetylase [Cladochytrium tenue]
MLRDARMQKRRDALPGVFGGNDVTEASGYVDWKWCDANKSSETWGLAYDDGPGVYTPQLLDHLKSKHLTATFFTIGSRIMGNPDIMQRAYSEGHQIGLLELVGSGWADLISIPDGDIDDRVRGVLKAMGLRVVIWGVESHDSDAGANLTSVAAAVSSWGSDADDRAISIEHDLFDYQAEASVAAVDSLLAFGRDPVPIAECVGKSLSDSYDLTPLSQFFDDGYFDGKKATSTLSASVSATSSAPNSSATTVSASSLGMNKGGNTSTVTQTSSSFLATSTAMLATTSDASTAVTLAGASIMTTANGHIHVGAGVGDAAVDSLAGAARALREAAAALALVSPQFARRALDPQRDAAGRHVDLALVALAAAFTIDDDASDSKTTLTAASTAAAVALLAAAPAE